MSEPETPATVPGALISDDVSRRRVLAMTAATPLAAAARPRARIGAVAFDAFVLFDIRALATKARELFGPQGDDLRALWLQKLFAYTWLRTTARQYAPFSDVAAEALTFAATASGMAVSPGEARELLDTLNALPAWPDVREGLTRLRARGLRTALLSNMSEPMLRSNLRHNALEPLIDVVLSTDRVRAFKPAPEAYAMGPKVLGLPKTRIAFVAYGAWDAAGARWFGYPTAWVDRTGQAPETLAPPISYAGRDLDALEQLLRGEGA